MERLTRTCGDELILAEGATIPKIVEKLFDYENLEMSPAEIEELLITAADLEARLENKGNDCEKLSTTADFMVSKRVEILDRAKKCIAGDRAQDYGNAENSFAVIAGFWQTYLNAKCVNQDGYVTLKPEDACALMCLFKLSRVATGHNKEDNWVDCIGYAACGGELESKNVKGGCFNEQRTS